MAAVPQGVPFFDQTAQVFTEDINTGEYAVPGATFACRLAHNRTGQGETDTDRAELAAQRRLIWPPELELPEHCEVEVEGIRWRPLAGTFGRYRDWTSRPVYRVAMMSRQQQAGL